MLRQTLLKFKGALGMIGFNSLENESDGDTSSESESDSSEDEIFESKHHYTSTGVIVPKGQLISEIIVSRLTMKEISDQIEKYKKKTKKLTQFFRVFDTKDMVSKNEKISVTKTKVPAEDVHKLALDAYHLFEQMMNQDARSLLIPKNSKKLATIHSKK
jgi:hypothetical protein